MELDPNALRDFMGGLGLQHPLVVLLGVRGEALVVDGRAGLQQERIEDRRLASAVGADEYHEPRTSGYVSYRELGESLVVLQVYFLYSHPFTLVAPHPDTDPSNRHYRPPELSHLQILLRCSACRRRTNPVSVLSSCDGPDAPR